MKHDKSKNGLPDQASREFITGENAEGVSSKTSREGLSHNIFVRAGAGAGKTHSIQRRVKNLFLYRDLKPEQLAVITYTTKAAAELKDRIRSIMEKTAIAEQDESLRQKAVSVLDELNKAKISTVHSFCFDLLKEFPVEFDIDPACEVADERKSSTIQSEVIHQFYLLEAEKDPRFETAVKSREILKAEYADSVSDDVMFDVFSVLYANRELNPRKLRVDDGTNSEARQQRDAQEMVGAFCDDLLVNIEKEISDPEDKLYLQLESIKHYLGRFGIEGRNRKRLKELTAAILQSGTNPFPNKGTQGNYKRPDFLREYKARVRTFSELISSYQLSRSATCYNLLLDVYPVYRTLYDKFKRTQGVLDFADCLILLRDGLRDNAFLRAALQRRFLTIIVDEFQDSDPLQAEILFYLAAEDAKAKDTWKKLKPTPGMLLFVGDPKQSIYGFARADIAIYLSVMKLITSWDKSADRVFSANFRSFDGIVDFVNTYFSQIIKRHPEEEFASPQYEEMEATKLGSGKEPQVKVLEVSLDLASDQPGIDGVSQAGRLGLAGKRNREAWLVGKFIKNEIVTKGRNPGDFLILFRKTAGMADYEEIFEFLGVPVINTKTRSFLQMPEVFPLLSLAGAMVNPDSAHYLYALLRSCLFGYSDVAIKTLFSSIPSKNLSLATLAEKDPSVVPLAEVAYSNKGLVARFEAACKCIQLYSSAEEKSRDNFIAAMLKLTEILKAELELNDFDESRTLENIQGGALSTGNFGWGEEEEMEEEKLLLQTEEPSKVRLMTMHGAKGLEAKCVVLTNPGAKGMGRISTLIDRNSELIIPLGKRICGQDLADQAELSRDVEREAVFKAEEEKRVLYVAATRAIEQLLIVKYSGDEPGDFMEPLLSLLDEAFPTERLELDEAYRERHAPKGISEIVPSKPIPEEEHRRLQDLALAKIRQRTQTSEAVTTTLKTEGEKVFKGNPDGRERGKEFGSLVHEAMELICQRAGEKKVTTEHDLNVILLALNTDNYGFEAADIGAIALGINKFLAAPLYQTILQADMVLPEVAFKVKGKVHGIIDLLYQDKSGLHVIDWKSDVFEGPEREMRVKDFYHKQIQAYVEALTQGLGQTVASAECIYLF